MTYIQSTSPKNGLEELIVLDVHYTAVKSTLTNYEEELVNKVVIDIMNPINFDTLDDLVVPFLCLLKGVFYQLLEGSINYEIDSIIKLCLM